MKLATKKHLKDAIIIVDQENKKESLRFKNIIHQNIVI